MPHTAHWTCIQGAPLHLLPKYTISAKFILIISSFLPRFLVSSGENPRLDISLPPLTALPHAGLPASQGFGTPPVTGLYLGLDGSAWFLDVSHIALSLIFRSHITEQKGRPGVPCSGIHTQAVAYKWQRNCPMGRTPTTHISIGRPGDTLVRQPAGGTGGREPAISHRPSFRGY